MATIAKDRHLSLGLITATVSVLSATKQVSRKAAITVCNHEDHEPTRIRQEKVCDSCGGVPLQEEKAWPTAGGYAILNQEDLTQVTQESVEQLKGFNLEVFDGAEIDVSSQGGKVYYLNPAPGSETSYSVLKEIVRLHPELALMSRTALRTKATPYRLIVLNGVLAIQERLPQDAEVLAPPVINENIDAETLSLASVIVENMKRVKLTQEYLLNPSDIAKEKIANSKEAVSIIGVAKDEKVQTANDLKKQLAEEMKRIERNKAAAERRRKKKEEAASKPRKLKAVS